MSHGFKLTQEIIDLSDANSWDRARLEWEIEEIYREDEPETCLCGHFPINELCFLRNRMNGNRALVGNVCVKKFLGLRSDKLFGSIKRIAKDITRALNAETVAHAHEKSWINQWEFKFYMDTMRKRKLSEKQAEKRRQINAKVLAKVHNARRSQDG